MVADDWIINKYVIWVQMCYIDFKSIYGFFANKQLTFWENQVCSSKDIVCSIETIDEKENDI